MKYLKLFELFEPFAFDIEKISQDIKDFCIYIEDLRFKVEINDLNYPWRISKKFNRKPFLHIMIHKDSKYFEICDEVTDCIIQIYEYMMNINRFKSDLYFSSILRGYSKSNNFIVHSYDVIKIERQIDGSTYYEIPHKNYLEWNRINMQFYF